MLPLQYIDEPSLILATHVYIKAYMSQFDSSHDYSHILRVLTLSNTISAAADTPPTNPTVITLLALLHDVGDKKYLPPTPNASPSSTASLSPIGLGPAEEFLVSSGCEPNLAATVQSLVNNVSYSHEQRHPSHVADLCMKFPELAVVQDADRLDAIGAVGMGRAFTFGAAKRSEDGMEGVMRHFEEKLVRLEGGMKTEEGKRLARVRGERIRLFKGWWEEEMKGVEESLI